MLGNDIVDLTEAKLNSSWQRERFLDKLFTQSEQSYIRESENPFHVVWQLWSMKESAYKLYTQLNPSRFYNPKAFQCLLNNSGGIVLFKAFKCYIKTIITSDYIVSEARLTKTEMTSEVVAFKTSDYQKQSAVLKTKLIEKMIKAKPDYQIVSIIKDDFGIPKLKANNLLVPVSFTHHGTFGAFAF